jgi:hypothetical protein
MLNNHRMTLSAIAALSAIGCVAATAVHADSRQNNKNFWRNAAIASGAVAAYGLTHHKDTLTIAGAAGAVYSGQRYEDDRRSQSRQNSGYRNWYREGSHSRYHHDHGHHYGWRNHPERHHHDDDDND